MRLLKNIGNWILDIFFPAVCLNCRRGLIQIEKPQHICRFCAKTIIIHHYFENRSSFILSAATDYKNEVIRNLIHYFKYNGFMAIAEPLAELMIKHLEVSLIFEEAKKFNLIVPIPLHPSRFRQRGFNQSEKLGQFISQRLNIPIENRALIRIKNTSPQIDLNNKKQRNENIKNAFEINSKYRQQLKNKSIILIDDVFTSGATAKEAVKILKQAGIKKIMVLVAAKT